MKYEEIGRGREVERMKEIEKIKGVREKKIVGYGIVIGIKGKGERMRN